MEKENWYQKNRQKLLNVYLPEAAHLELKIWCAQHGISISTFVKAAIVEKMQRDAKAHEKRLKELQKQATAAKAMSAGAGKVNYE